MQVVAPFGIITGCHAGDRFMVQATLASVRQYLPEIPVCLVADGAVDVSDLEAEYDLIVLRVSELSSSVMRGFSGSFHAKQVVMWEGPFERFVWLDSDAIVWGNFIEKIREDLDFQILWSEISIPEDSIEAPGWLAHYYFDLDRLLQIDPEFKWQGLPYFAAGVFAARRNVIGFDHYLEIKELSDRNPGLFAFGDMGILNYLVHSLSQKGEIRSGMTDLQHVWMHHGTAEFEADCVNCGWRFPKKVARPRIGHFCGRKPRLFDRHAYSRPFTIARLEHYRRSRGELGAWFAVIKEEVRILRQKVRGRKKRFRKK